MNDHHPLREAAEAATAGEWRALLAHSEQADVIAFLDDGESWDGKLQINGRPAREIVSCIDPKDAVFIARANPSKVIALLDENAGLRAVLERRVQDIDDVANALGPTGDWVRTTAALRQSAEAGRQALGSGK